MTPDVNCCVANLPTSIPAFVIHESDGNFTIILNAKHTHEQHLLSYHHEMRHIENGDYDQRNVDLMEIYAHGLK